jgi:HD superfamily phosphohydrolase YqeK
LDAIRHHSTGRPSMSKLEKIVYVSDYSEPFRKYPDVDMIRTLSFDNLDRAAKKTLLHKTAYLKKNKLPVDPRSLCWLKNI